MHCVIYTCKQNKTSQYNNQLSLSTFFLPRTLRRQTVNFWQLRYYSARKGAVFSAAAPGRAPANDDSCLNNAAGHRKLRLHRRDYSHAMTTKGRACFESQDDRPSKFKTYFSKLQISKNIEILQKITKHKIHISFTQKVRLQKCMKSEPFLCHNFTLRRYGAGERLRDRFDRGRDRRCS